MFEKMFNLETWEFLSYLVTVVGLPFAFYVFWLEQKRERLNEEEELYQKLSDEYSELLQLLLKNADLQLYSKDELNDADLTKEQKERRNIIFDLIVSLFERAYILVYEEKMTPQQKRLWGSWEDYMRYWCRRKDFRAVLPELLHGEDPGFEAYMTKIAQEAHSQTK